MSRWYSYTVKYLFLSLIGFRGKEFVLQGVLAGQFQGDGTFRPCPTLSQQLVSGLKKVHTEHMLNEYAFKHQPSLSH